MLNKYVNPKRPIVGIVMLAPPGIFRKVLLLVAAWWPWGGGGPEVAAGGGAFFLFPFFVGAMCSSIRGVVRAVQIYIFN